MPFIMPQCHKWLARKEIYLGRLPHGVPDAEKLRCNICDVVVEISEAKDHAASGSHSRLKSKLEGELAVARARMYAEDNSVASRWAAAT
jgi:hypothetical protein